MPAMKSALSFLAVACVLCLPLLNRAATPTAGSTEPAILSGGGDKTGLEGVLTEITPQGTYALDSGTILKTSAELAAWLEAHRDTFTPRLVLQSAAPDATYYHLAMQALLLFKQHCRAYEVMVQKSTR